MTQVIDLYHEVIKEEYMINQERMNVIEDCLSIYLYQNEIDICDDSLRELDGDVGKNNYHFKFNIYNQLEKVIKNNN